MVSAVADAITWFYDRDDGEYEYWPRHGEGRRERSGPFGNLRSSVTTISCRTGSGRSAPPDVNRWVTQHSR
jgi:hypothetical protein